MILKHKSGKEIHLDENTEDISKLKNQLMLLGMNGLAYSEIWNNKLTGHWNGNQEVYVIEFEVIKE